MAIDPKLEAIFKEWEIMLSEKDYLRYVESRRIFEGLVGQAIEGHGLTVSIEDFKHHYKDRFNEWRKFSRR